MREVTLGKLDPQHIQTASNLRQTGMEHHAKAKKAAAMSRHPSVRGTSRSAEFHDQAKAHLGRAQEAKKQSRALGAKKTGQSFMANESHEANKRNAYAS